MTAAEGPPRRGKLAGYALLGAVVIGVLVVSLALRPDQTGPPQSGVASEPGVVEEVSIDFADDRHGFALRSRCVENACERALLVTDDGERWTVQDLDVSEFTDDEHAWVDRVYALGPCRVAVGNDSLHEADRFRAYSADCGHTWHPVDLDPVGTVAEIPDGGILESACDMPPRGRDCEDHRLLVTRPDSGRRSWLATSPELKLPRPAPVPAADGSWVAHGWDPVTDELAVAVSRDDGHTWSVSGLGLRDFDTWAVTVTFGEHHGYVMVTGRQVPLLAVFHSEDGGTTWQRTWEATPEEPRFDASFVGTPIARADDLFILGPEGKWRSPDHGRTFRTSPTAIRLDRIEWTRGGYVATKANPTTDEVPTWYRSPDGAVWEEIDFPR